MLILLPLSLLLSLVTSLSSVPFNKSNTNLHSGNEFNDSIVEDDNKEVADIFDGVIGDIGKEVIDVVSCSTASAISSVLDQNNLCVVSLSLLRVVAV